jgi:CheY-like chemotaxis protein
MILAIDDDPMMRYLWAEIRTGLMPVQHVLSVDQALVHAAEEQYRLIIIDRMMLGGHVFPEASEIEVGILLYRRIRQERPEVPIAILTSYYEGERGREMEMADSRFRMLAKSDSSDDILFALDALVKSVYGDDEGEETDELTSE